jgi:bacteriorhodopsin
MLADRSIVENQVFSTAQYDLVYYFLVITAFGLVAGFLYSWTGRDEVSARYRPAVVASLCITGIATLSYLVLIIKWDSGYTLVGDHYVPGPAARFSVVPRYMDWSITVPLLTAELIAVCAVAGKKARNLRASTMIAAFLMILTGFIGAKVIDQGTNVGALVLWGLISTLFMCYLYPVLMFAVRDSLGTLSPEAGHTLKMAVTLLLSVFVVYPLVFAIPVFFNPTARWTTGIQIAFSVADVTAKVGFGALIHKVAKLRTAQDILEGTDTHPEPVWISQVEYSPGVQPALKEVLVGSTSALTPALGRQEQGLGRSAGRPSRGSTNPEATI